MLVGFHTVTSGKPSVTWPESVDEALCFGWIDGVRRRVDELSYTIRFTPRDRAASGARQEATRLRRTATLVDLSAWGKLIPQFQRYHAPGSVRRC